MVSLGQVLKGIGGSSAGDASHKPTITKTISGVSTDNNNETQTGTDPGEAGKQAILDFGETTGLTGRKLDDNGDLIPTTGYTEGQDKEAIDATLQGRFYTANPVADRLGQAFNNESALIDTLSSQAGKNGIPEAPNNYSFGGNPAGQTNSNYQDQITNAWQSAGGYVDQMKNWWNGNGSPPINQNETSSSSHYHLPAPKLNTTRFSFNDLKDPEAIHALQHYALDNGFKFREIGTGNNKSYVIEANNINATQYAKHAQEMGKLINSTQPGTSTETKSTESAATQEPSGKDLVFGAAKALFPAAATVLEAGYNALTQQPETTKTTEAPNIKVENAPMPADNGLTQSYAPNFNINQLSNEEFRLENQVKAQSDAARPEAQLAEKSTTDNKQQAQAEAQRQEQQAQQQAAAAEEAKTATETTNE